MAFEIFLHPTTTTGGPKAFNAGVSQALTAVGAQHSAAAETVRLVDHSQIHVFLDGEDDIAMVTAEDMSPAVAAAVWRMASDTGSMINVGRTFYAVPGSGEVPTGLAMGFPGALTLHSLADFEALLSGAFEDWEAGEATEVLRQEAVATAVKARRKDAPRPHTPMVDLVSRPQSSILRRLSDALFGKSI